jgi:probable addiction module antidote protein
MPAYFVGSTMPQRSSKAPIRPQPGRREVTDRINRAFETSDIDEIRHAIGNAIRRYNISDIAKVSGLERPTIYRAFEGDMKHPNFKTVVSVLDAMGFQMHVTVRRDCRVRLARPKAVSRDSVERRE